MQLHQQDVTDFCGAAVAQMMIGAHAAAMPDQETLFAQLHDKHEYPQWTAAPQLLATRLSEEPTTGFTAYFDPEAGTAYARIVQTTATGVAVPVVVLGGAHWIALTATNGGGGLLAGFSYDDPYPQTASQAYSGMETPPLAHCAEDWCGTGGYYGYTDAYVSLAGWLQTYWPGPCPPPYADPPAYITVCPPGPALEPISLAPRRRCTPHDIANAPISATQAMDCALRGIAEHGLDRRGPLAGRLHGAEPCAADLVRRDGTPAELYYIVTLAQHGTSVAMARVDAHDGAFLGAIAGDRVHPLPPRDRDSALQTLVWRPCRESMSPYYPFAQIDVRGTTIFLGCDGRTHERLRTDVRA